MVRVARGSYSDYIRPLELDAAGIMVPHIMSLGDARSVLRMTRFHPVGRRPIDGGNADGAYAQTPLGEYIRGANEDRFIIFQIEDPEPLAEIEAIAALPGLDMLFFGPGDFSHGLGAPGDFTHPELINARKRMAEASLAAGKFAGTTGAVGAIREFLEMGYRFLAIGADVLGLGPYFNRLVKEFAAIVSDKR
jgi:4-hydroxy-2-oxoheptanedioate aldolase